MSVAEPEPLGLVLSGGGARGAYEAGVLAEIFSTLEPGRGLGRSDVITGTSVGSFNGAFLASTLDDPRAGSRRLAELWERLELEQVLKFRIESVPHLPVVLRGGEGDHGLFDGPTFGGLIEGSTSWPQLTRNIREGHLGALAITATRVATGEAVVFVEHALERAVPRQIGANIVVRPVRIRAPHVQASSAMPMLLPPVRIKAELYADGGLTLNTPIAPAIHLGASRLLIIAFTKPEHSVAEVAPGRTPGMAFLLGKGLNALHLDRTASDLESLEKINRLLEDGTTAYGPGFVDRLATLAKRRGQAPLRPIETLVISPSVDLGAIARDYLVERAGKIDGALGRLLALTVDVGEERDADLASYLLFESGFTKRLVDLGRRDARALRDRIRALFCGMAT